MTLTQVEKRLAALENAVAKLQEQIVRGPDDQRPWWVTEAGRFANDPVFEEIVRLGREYRESLHPDRMKKQKKKKANART